MDGPKDESSKKKEDLGVNWSIWEDSETEDQDGKLSSASQSSKKKEDLGVKEDNKDERGSIHSMKADSKATSITNSTVSASLDMNGPKEESSKKKEDLGVKEDDKADRGYHYRSIHYRSIHDMKADSKANSITNSSVSASLDVNGPKDERSKKKEDLDVKEDDKAERGSIHTMEDLDGKLFSDWSEYSRKKHKKRMGTMKADSEATATTSSSISTALDMGIEDEERMTWGGRFSINLHYLLNFWSFSVSTSSSPCLGLLWALGTCGGFPTWPTRTAAPSSSSPTSPACSSSASQSSSLRARWSSTLLWTQLMLSTSRNWNWNCFEFFLPAVSPSSRASTCRTC